MSYNKMQVYSPRELKLMAINERTRKEEATRKTRAPVLNSSGQSNKRWNLEALVFPTAFYIFLVPTRRAK